jgi:hypothetical protein
LAANRRLIFIFKKIGGVAASCEPARTSRLISKRASQRVGIRGNSGQLEFFNSGAAIYRTLNRVLVIVGFKNNG